MTSGSWRIPHHRKNDYSENRIFEVRNRSWQCKSEINESPPVIVGYFSLDGNRTYLSNSSNLSYYKPPTTEKVHLDLNQGIEKVRRKLPSADEEKINNLLQWIKLHHEEIEAPTDSKKWIQPDFVCFRGLLTILLCTPFSPRDPWIICAGKWKGTIYLCAFKTPEEKRRHANMTKDDLKFMSWGFKFEQYILTDAPDHEPDPSKPVDEAAEFCCMFQRTIGDHTILYGAEMDGVTSSIKLDDPLPLKNLKFVELKTSRAIEHDGQERNFRKFKLLKWWSQSHLVGIDKILCGFRNDTGIVKNLTTYSLSEIIEKSKAYWNPKTCLNFCQAFLTHVAKVVINDCDKTIYKFEKIPFENVVITEMSPTSEYGFMDSSFLDATG